MPRSQNAHAIINAGFLFKFKQNEEVLEKMSIVYGNISPKFIHADKTEQALINKDPFTDDALQIALKTLSSEINPDEASPEPSPEYRKTLALALFYKVISHFVSIVTNFNFNSFHKVEYFQISIKVFANLS